MSNHVLFVHLYACSMQHTTFWYLFLFTDTIGSHQDQVRAVFCDRWSQKNLTFLIQRQMR